MLIRSSGVRPSMRARNLIGWQATAGQPMRLCADDVMVIYRMDSPRVTQCVLPAYVQRSVTIWFVPLKDWGVTVWSVDGGGGWPRRGADH